MSIFPKGRKTGFGLAGSGKESFEYTSIITKDKQVQGRINAHHPSKEIARSVQARAKRIKVTLATVKFKDP